MFIEPAILSLLIAKLRGGQLKNIENVEVKGWYLLFISAFIQLYISLGKAYNLPYGEKVVSEYFFILIIISYMLMIITILMNKKKNYMRIFLIGIILNFIVIAGNGGKMPVSLGGIGSIKEESLLPEREFDIKHIGVNENTRFVYLSDIILIPRPYPLPKILSIGDVFLILGIFIFFQEEMVLKRRGDFTI